MFKSRALAAFFAVCLVSLSGCGPSAAQEAEAARLAAQKQTSATFEPVYRASKAVQGATESGVSFVKFGELMQAFSTELGIAKDQELNASGKQLLTLYQEAFEAYQFSRGIWHEQIKYPSLETVSIIDSAQQIEHFKLTIVSTKDISVPGYPDATLKYLARDSFQQVWVEASAILGRATGIYYGKLPPPA